MKNNGNGKGNGKEFSAIDTQAALLFSSGKSYRVIAKTLGLSSKSEARKRVAAGQRGPVSRQ
jgi:hypothetical protein